MADLLHLTDRSRRQLTDLVHRIHHQPDATSVAGKRIALLWNGLAFRNRAAVDLAAAELGLVCVEAKSSLGGRERARDLARYLDNWFDAVVVRGANDAQLAEFATVCDAGVINAGGPDSHPTEVLSDIAYLWSRFGGVRGMTVGFVGPATNVLSSWMEASARLDIRILQITPDEFRATPPDGAAFVATEDPDALAGADVVYSDCWWPVRLAEPDERRRLRRRLDPYRLTMDLIAHAPSDAPVLHGPPVTPGLEMDADVQRLDRYVAYEAKRWLLPTFSALLTEVLTG
jgi:ornithine carbamoyltransferase